MPFYEVKCSIFGFYLSDFGSTFYSDRGIFCQSAKYIQGIRTQIVKSNLSLRERRRKISDFSNTFSYTPDMYFLWYIIIFWLKLGVFSQISIFQNNFFISKIFFEIFWKIFFRFKFLFGLIYGEKKIFEKISKKILTQKK